MDSGELFVMMDLVRMMPILFADNLDMTELLPMITSQCKKLIDSMSNCDNLVTTCFKSEVLQNHFI